MKNLEEYNRYKYVVENIKDIIWEMDTNFIFTYVSSSTKEALGYEKNEVVGKCMFDLLTIESKEQVLYTWKSRLSNNDKSKVNLYETQFLCKDGSTIWLEVSVKPIIEENRRIRYIGVSRDISEKKVYENELKKYVDELKNTNEKLRESEEKFRQLFENMTNGF
ncbi:MAG TPA: PAS domain S-box protein, partial [Clostridia bacterium]